MSSPAHDRLTAPRNARLEAQDVAGDQFVARVLEPSPPAVIDGDLFADDPVAAGGAMPGRLILGPAGNGDRTWDEWVQERPEHAGWAGERWLGSYRRLPDLPRGWAESRRSLHRLAVYVVSPARRRANGKIGLRWTLAGFGTPFYAGAGGDEQVRVVGTSLVRQIGDTATVEPLSTLGAAARSLGQEPDVEWAKAFDVPTPGDAAEPLGISPEAASFLGEWSGFSWSVLEELRVGPGSVEPTRVQLWPEHFDAAFDGSSAGGRRATFGASPGDAAIAEPYLYVLPGDPDALAPDDRWNATGFRGAVCVLRELVDAPDQRGTALAFFRQRQALLDGR